MRSTHRAVIAIVTALSAAVAFTGPGSSAASARPGGGGRGGLDPGAFVTYQQTVPVNVVLVGYDKSEVGLRFNYSYRVIDTPTAFDDKFFGQLASTGVPGPLTSVQQDYNDQLANIRDVNGSGPDDRRTQHRAVPRTSRTDRSRHRREGWLHRLPGQLVRSL